jgi:serine phosphatase RsbU (regulator of sigma subunit)
MADARREERMGFLLEHLNRQSKTSLLIRAYLTIALIAAADYLTGPDPSFFVFYFVPIIVVSWYVGRMHGLTIALTAALVSLVQELLFMRSILSPGVPELLTYWGLLQRSIAFLIVSITISALKNSEERKRELDYEVARQVQSFLLPGTVPSLPHFDCYGLMKPSDQLSGDLFDCVLLGSGKLGIIVGDVCGKGIPAALLAAYMQGVLRSFAPLRPETLGDLMSGINRALYASTPEEKFATLFIGIYDEVNGTITYVNAGHEPPRVFRRDGRALKVGTTDSSFNALIAGKRDGKNRFDIVPLDGGGMILGVDPSAEYPRRIQSMSVGDILICETDGVEEARNHLGELYGLERLTRVVLDHAEKSPEELHALVMNDIREFVGLEPQFDDMTLVIGKVV